MWAILGTDSVWFFHLVGLLFFSIHLLLQWVCYDEIKHNTSSSGSCLTPNQSWLLFCLRIAVSCVHIFCCYLSAFLFSLLSASHISECNNAVTCRLIMEWQGRSAMITVIMLLHILTVLNDRVSVTSTPFNSACSKLSTPIHTPSSRGNAAEPKTHTHEHKIIHWE